MHLGLLKQKTDEQIKKDLEKKRENILRRADILKKFINSDSSGWTEYRKLIAEYIDACKKRKSITAMDRLIPGNMPDERVLHELKLLDHEIYILSWVLEFPMDAISQAEQIIAEGNK